MSFPIQITPAGESADCRCTDSACEFAEETSGHAGVLQGLAHAAEHSLTTGHRVTEHVVRDSVVSIPPMLGGGGQGSWLPRSASASTP